MGRNSKVFQLSYLVMVFVPSLDTHLIQLSCYLTGEKLIGECVFGKYVYSSCNIPYEPLVRES